ncbi:MAG: hypothetical protein IPJ68_02860 [Candidatus Moraniibacteriota bacterium]|nr:MAG: hypothetical protein IPJ68_02860 [Candidatus Moranbacteria bacterium]
MLSNLFRRSFWAVFVPLLLAAGLFWMDELRGYSGEMSLFILPKTVSATGAAANLVALSRETSFALAVYAATDTLESPFAGKTPAERRAIWQDRTEVRSVGQSDVIHVSSHGDDSDEAEQLTQAIVAELVRTASRYYNQKTDIDIRIVGDLVIIPRFTAWPRFLFSAVATALFFTTLFFSIYRLIEWVFPERHSRRPGDGEYVISSETFKPRVPTYWGHEESVSPAESETLVPEESVTEPVVAPEPTASDMSAMPSEMIDTTAEGQAEETVETGEYAKTAAAEAIEQEAAIETEEWTVEDGQLPEDNHSLSYEAERAGLTEDVSAGYVSHAAAPDNLPIVDGPITPLQGAQARLMKADIDATAEANAAAAEPVFPEVAKTEPTEPQTHEPTREDYRRRLNELLSGKM